MAESTLRRRKRKNKHAHTILHATNHEAILATPIPYEDDECEVGCDNEFDPVYGKTCEQVAEWEVQIPVVYISYETDDYGEFQNYITTNKLDWHEKQLCTVCKERLFAFHRAEGKKIEKEKEKEK